MNTSTFSAVDCLGEPVIVKRGYQLCALLKVCEQVASSLENVGDGPYRDRITSSLSSTMELAEDIASELLIALERVAPRRMEKGGVE